MALTAPFYTVQNQNDFQRNLAKGRPNAWQCGAGGRYLYICEDGLVHWCSQQRGYPGVPLAHYTRSDVERESTSEKSCSPLCTVSCVHRVALLDRLRVKPMETIDDMLPPVGMDPSACGSCDGDWSQVVTATGSEPSRHVSSARGPESGQSRV